MLDELQFWFLVVLAIMALGTAFTCTGMSSRQSREEDEWPEIDTAHLHDTDNHR